MKIDRPVEWPFEESTGYLREKFAGKNHDIAVVLGSGLGGFTRHIAEEATLSTADIPGYPRSTVTGHSGRIISARVTDKRVLVFSGRVHYYESASTLDAAVTAMVSHSLGIKTIVLTNAAGILNENFYPGDLMLVKDQLNLTSRNVLADLHFPVVNVDPIYSERMARLMYEASEKAGINLKAGTYVGLTGPSYETPAEVRMYRRLGGDAVGMSTVHEAIFARAAGMDVVGISCLTNYSTGITPEKLSHAEVTEIGARVDNKFSSLLTAFISSL